MLFFFLVLIIIFVSRNLLLVLLLIEMLGFFLISVLSFSMMGVDSVDFVILFVFISLVMEGVIGLCGLIMLVSFAGSDYLKQSSFLKL